MQVLLGVRLWLEMHVRQVAAFEQVRHGKVQLTQMVPLKNWLEEH